MFGISLCLGAGSNCKLKKSHFGGVGNLQVEVHELIDSHDSSFITTSVAVIRRTENCHDVAVVRPVISIHYQLVSTGYSRQVICVIKLLRNVLAE